jgi:hypothetical protein
MKCSSRWLKSQLFWAMPEQVLAPTVPGQPPLSRWMAQIDSSARPCERAKVSTC